MSDEKDATELSSENLAAGVVDDRPSLVEPLDVKPLDDEDLQHNAAAEAEEERLDRETPAALDHLSATAEKFLKDPGVEL